MHARFTFLSDRAEGDDLVDGDSLDSGESAQVGYCGNAVCTISDFAAGRCCYKINVATLSLALQEGFCFLELYKSVV